MLKLGQKVVIISDQFEQNLPIGEYGYLIAYERNADNVFDYIVRVPKMNKNYFVPDIDVELEEQLLLLEVERIEREALIDYALATRNQELFNRILNGEEEEEVTEEPVKEAITQEEFIRQVNLKAWI